MPIERPTFHESWYRVAELHPRLRTTVQISRQHFRGQAWHVVQDHSNNAFFRLAEPAYHFIGLLDGKRTVGEAWNTANAQLGDDAPTQGEVIQLLGQLYTQNLLQADVSADAHTLFSRYKKRKQREITTYLMNIMFSRIPIFDPDRFLNATLPIFGWIFSPIGLCVWLVLIALGIHSITNVSNWSRQNSAARPAVCWIPENLIILYVGFALIKACHEMGHAISCKKFGKQAGTGGEVHIIGIMLLVFTPVPYVDASSSWALQNKWHRIIVGAAGMWVELAIASIAAIVWANSGDSGTPWVNHFAYNVMFVAGFSTIVFNANPLLRYDGYYILSDFLEIPNLAQRGKEYIYYVVKRYIWNVRQARSPAIWPVGKILAVHLRHRILHHAYLRDLQHHVLSLWRVKRDADHPGGRHDHRRPYHVGLRAGGQVHPLPGDQRRAEPRARPCHVVIGRHGSGIALGYRIFPNRGPLAGAGRRGAGDWVCA